MLFFFTKIDMLIDLKKNVEKIKMRLMLVFDSDLFS